MSLSLASSLLAPPPSQADYYLTNLGKQVDNLSAHFDIYFGPGITYKYMTARVIEEPPAAEYRRDLGIFIERMAIAASKAKLEMKERPDDYKSRYFAILEQAYDDIIMKTEKTRRHIWDRAREINHGQRGCCYGDYVDASQKIAILQNISDQVRKAILFQKLIQ